MLELTQKPSEEGSIAANAARRRELAREMQARQMENLINKTTDSAPSYALNDPAACADPRWLEAERREIFRKLPLLAGLTRDIPNPGDRMLFEAAGPSILIVRAKDSSVRAYFNMCRHRAAKLVTECRNRNLITCTFHGWTYDLEGRLIGFPGRESFEGLDKSTLGLISVPVGEWGGMIFVIARAGDEHIDVEAYLGKLAPEMLQFDFALSKPIKNTRFDANGNWKSAIDTYGEGYHLAALHPESVNKVIVTNSVIYDDLLPHHRMGYPLITLLDDINKPREEWPESPLSVIYLLFPNTIVMVSPRGAGISRTGHSHHFYRIFPGEAPGQSFTLLNSYRSVEVPEETPTKQWEDAHDFQVKIVGDEDYSVVATAQHNLEYAPEGFRTIFGRNEISLQRFHRRVAELIGRPVGG